jgi:hypothetical protein
VFLAEAGTAPTIAKRVNRLTKRASERNAMKRFSVICLQCGLSIGRRIDAETAQTEIHPMAYRQKCKIAPNAADFDCPELERAVERSRRWDTIFQSGMSRLASSDDAIVFPEALSEAAVVAEKAEPSAEVASLPARMDAMDMADAAPTTPVDLDELRDALSKPLNAKRMSKAFATAADIFEPSTVSILDSTSSISVKPSRRRACVAHRDGSSWRGASTSSSARSSQLSAAPPRPSARGPSSGAPFLDSARAGSSGMAGFTEFDTVIASIRELSEGTAAISFS